MSTEPGSLEVVNLLLSQQPMLAMGLAAMPEERFALLMSRVRCRLVDYARSVEVVMKGAAAEPF